jgi:hypothetical protein
VNKSDIQILNEIYSNPEQRNEDPFILFTLDGSRGEVEVKVITTNIDRASQMARKLADAANAGSEQNNAGTSYTEDEVHDFINLPGNISLPYGENGMICIIQGDEVAQVQNMIDTNPDELEEYLDNIVEYK